MFSNTNTNEFDKHAEKEKEPNGWVYHDWLRTKQLSLSGWSYYSSLSSLSLLEDTNTNNCRNGFFLNKYIVTIGTASMIYRSTDAVILN